MILQLLCSLQSPEKFLQTVHTLSHNQIPDALIQGLGRGSGMQALQGTPAWAAPLGESPTSENYVRIIVLPPPQTCNSLHPSGPYFPGLQSRYKIYVPFLPCVTWTNWDDVWGNHCRPLISLNIYRRTMMISAALPNEVCVQDLQCAIWHCLISMPWPIRITCWQLGPPLEMLI